ncbi:MAG: phenylalanine--tRNA ligase subunit beta [Candidatus Poribacteria bacterium]|nr:phenylalanine--tRNA ligase subunit beta [Candidatus Poribacteria bacterium]
MNVTLNWLKNYIDFELSPSELADRLTMLGVEVESIKQLGAELEGVVVGSVGSIKPHPNADKLVLCQVDIGEMEGLQIVCGAPNVREGMLAPVATIGATLPIGLTIKRAKLRGETSQGMLCSEKELGLSEDAAGLMELPTETPLGTSISEALGLDDVVFELEITPNRPDCLSLIGVAREIRAETGNALKLPQVDFNEAETDIREITSVSIEAPDLCPRYAARVIRGVQVGQSPAWLQQRLESVGIGVINNIVDITNFVLMEYGQPLHAFDYHKLDENRIVVRRAAVGENLTTLDEIDRELTPDMLVIADAEKPVALAGVMGGYDSEITETTSDVLLESAYFNPSSIRATAKALGISTEASYRFERGADPGAVPAALDRAAQLVAELAGGSICKGVVDVYPGQQPLTEIQLRPERVNFILGTTLDTSEMVQILSDLGFDVNANGTGNYQTGEETLKKSAETPKQKPSSKNLLQITVPTFRSDVTREIDLIEEIARVYGYDNIPTTLPKGDIPVPVPNPSTEVRKHIKHFLLAAGMMEAINYSFCDPNCFDKIRFAADHPLRDVLKLQNPLSPEMSVLRTTLLPSLLENAQHNRNHQIDTIALFEIGSVFIRNGAEKEPERVTGILAGQVGDGVYSNPYREPDFYDIKGLVEGILEVCGIVDYTLEKTDAPTFHPGRHAAVLSSNKQIGIFGEAHPEVLENYDLPYKAYLFDFDMEALVAAAIFAKRFEPIPVYPKVERDLAIVVDKAVLSDMPTGLIYATGGELVESVRLFDVYEGEQVPEGKKSLAYAITYHSATETLTDKAVNALHDKVVKHLNQELGAELRM